MSQTTPAAVAHPLTEEKIFEIVARELGNPLLAEDLREGFSVHVDSEEWLKVANALHAETSLARNRHD